MQKTPDLARRSQVFFCLQFFFCLDPADHLGHGTHGAEAAPGSGFEQRIHHQANDGGGEHQAVETETELGDPIGHGTGGVSPAPGNPEHPQQFDGLPEAVCSGGYQISLENHVAEHAEEKHQKAIPEPFGRNPLGRFCIAGTFAADAKQLPSAAVAIAKSFVTAYDGNNQRHEEIDHAQPSKENIEKSQREVNDRPDPQVIIPMLFLHFSSPLSFVSMQPAGQALAHRPQPTHFASSTAA